MSKLENKKDHRGLRLDENDRQNLENALRIYDKRNPPGKIHVLDEEDPKTGKPIRYIEYCNIADHLRYVRYEINNSKSNKFKSWKGFDTPIKLKVSIPPSLEMWLNKAYPTLLTDEVQTNQFIKWFPKFDLTKD